MQGARSASLMAQGGGSSSSADRPPTAPHRTGKAAATAHNDAVLAAAGADATADVGIGERSQQARSLCTEPQLPVKCAPCAAQHCGHSEADGSVQDVCSIPLCRAARPSSLRKKQTARQPSGRPG